MSAEEPPATSPRRGPQRRTAVAAAVVLVLLVVAAVAAITLSGGGSKKPVAAPAPAATTPSPAPPPPSPAPTPTPDPQTYAYIVLHPGDCVNDPSRTASLKKLVKRACTAPHDEQVVSLVQLPGGLASDEAINLKAVTLCRPADTAAMLRQGGRADGLTEGANAPHLADYRGGRHTATCMVKVISPGSKLTSPLR
jgi:hypothetical protein